MEGAGPTSNVGHASREPGRHHDRVERLLIVRPQDDADGEAAASELEDLPGVVSVSVNALTGSFDVLFDAAVVSDDELAAALHHQGFDLVSWQEARQLHAAEQRTWLLEQIRSLSARAERELADRGTYADGITKGAVDAYLRAARAFGLVTDAEVIQLVPARFFERPIVVALFAITIVGLAAPLFWRGWQRLHSPAPRRIASRCRLPAPSTSPRP